MRTDLYKQWFGREGRLGLEGSTGDQAGGHGGSAMRVAFRVFRSHGFSDTQVEPTAASAAEYASSLRPDQVIGISHVLDGHIHIVTVWYWEGEATAEPGAAADGGGM